MITDRPDFPIGIDSTIRAAFVACPQKAFLEYFLHWKPRMESVDLVAGKAFAAGIEATIKAYYENNEPDLDTCIAYGARALITEWRDYEPPEGHVKQLDRMVGALDSYFRNYGIATDYIQPYIHEGKPAVEFSFALPIPGTKHPVTGDPILYTGRFDMLGLYNNMLFVRDEKTTKQLGPTWPKNWKMRSQITGYCWAAREYGFPVAGALIRGVSILKNSYGHAESIQYRDDWFIERWLEQLRRDVERMVQCWEEGYWDYDLDTACTSYGGCMFQDACSAKDPTRELENNFTRRVWDPLAHEEKPYEKAG